MPLKIPQEIPYERRSARGAEMIVLGVDCGTQSLKVVAWDPVRGTRECVSRAYGLIEGLPPGHKEQHPRVWLDALEHCLRALRGQGVAMSSVLAIGVSGQQHGLVALDGSDEVVRPAKLWCDTATAEQCGRIVAAAGGIEAYQAEIGNHLPVGFTASKILWLKEREPHQYKKARAFMLPHDYLNFHLTGERVAEAGDASGTGFFDVRRRRWSEAALGWIDPDRDLLATLPRLIPSSAPAGHLRAELASAWGMGGGVVVSAGGGDNMMGAIGSGNVQPGVLTMSLGTSGTLYACASAPVIDPEGLIAAFCDSTGGWLPLACTMNVTTATEMVRRQLLGGDHAQMDAAVEAVPPGAEGLMLLPYLEGERLPDVPEGTGVFFGVRPATATPAHMARAAMEGVTLGLTAGLARLRSLGVQLDTIRAIGGGARSRVWRQIVADVIGLPTICPQIEEGPALGAALQALWCLEGGDLVTMAHTYIRLDGATRADPNPAHRALYDDLFALHTALSGALIGAGLFPRHRRHLAQRQ